MAGITDVVGSVAGTSATARTPSRTPMPLGLGMGLLVEMGSIAPNVDGVASARSAVARIASQAGLGASVAGDGVDADGIAVDAIVGALARMATAPRPSAMALGRLAEMPPVGSPRLGGVANLVKIASFRGSGSDDGVAPTSQTGEVRTEVGGTCGTTRNGRRIEEYVNTRALGAS